MEKKLSNVIEGSLQANDLKFAIVCARFNDFFVSKLLDGAVDCISRHGGQSKDITVCWVPGSFEIPLVAQRLAETKKYDAIIALGVVIQGATSHAQFITSQVTSGLAEIGIKNLMPVIFGIVSAETIEHAIERSGSKVGNRGAEAAKSAIEMANLMKQI